MAKKEIIINRAIPVPAPSGTIAQPRLNTVRKDSRTEIVYASYMDPNTGQLFRRFIHKEIHETPEKKPI